MPQPLISAAFSAAGLPWQKHETITKNNVAVNGMKINVGNSGSKGANGMGDMVGLTVLAGEWAGLIQWTRLHEWLGNMVRSEAGRFVVYAAGFIALAFWGLILWRRVTGAVSWIAWIVAFGASGALSLYLVIVRNYSGAAKFIYAPIFIGQAMIGVAGFARYVAMNRGSDE